MPLSFVGKSWWQLHGVLSIQVLRKLVSILHLSPNVKLPASLIKDILCYCTGLFAFAFIYD